MNGYLTPQPEDDPMVLLTYSRAEFQASLRKAEADILATIDDDQPSITDIPWRF